MVTVTPIGIWQSFTVINKLLTVSLKPAIFMLRNEKSVALCNGCLLCNCNKCNLNRWGLYQNWLALAAYQLAIHSSFYYKCTSEMQVQICHRAATIRFSKQFPQRKLSLPPELKGFSKKLNYRRESSSFVTRSGARFSFAMVAVSL